MNRPCYTVSSNVIWKEVSVVCLKATEKDHEYISDNQRKTSLGKKKKHTEMQPAHSTLRVQCYSNQTSVGISTNNRPLKSTKLLINELFTFLVVEFQSSVPLMTEVVTGHYLAALQGFFQLYRVLTMENDN
jgi:hypothetical protein